MAARRIGELVPKETPKESGERGGRGKKASEERNPLSVTPQRLSEFRQLAKIPIEEFKGRIENAKAVPREFCEPVRRLINEAIKSGVREIPGVKIYEKTDIRYRT